MCQCLLFALCIKKFHLPGDFWPLGGQWEEKKIPENPCDIFLIKMSESILQLHITQEM